MNFRLTIFLETTPDLNCVISDVTLPHVPSSGQALDHLGTNPLERPLQCYMAASTKSYPLCNWETWAVLGEG